jgi:hypothetical protein
MYTINIVYIGYILFILFNIVEILYDARVNINLTTNSIINNGEIIMNMIINKHKYLSNIEMKYNNNENSMSLINLNKQKISYMNAVFDGYNIDNIIKLIPNTINEERWKKVMNDLSIHIADTHENIFYIELASLYKNIIMELNRNINPIENPIIYKYPILINYYDMNTGVIYTSNVDLELSSLTFIMTIGYVYHIIKKCYD